ncbi:unnamed protein product [Ambrosiozyma monospora]|uniref:Unnamed protein product n=1 Tax=Ambrosiozyma monospora TaxID=43982 RepID=A0ACB5T104_AMBMO|nr:unnamed protein product [Ambrosiozyma monospora]
MTAATDVDQGDNTSSLKHPTEILKVLLPEQERGKAISNIVYNKTSPRNRSRSNTVNNDKTNDSGNLPPHLITDITELKFLLESSVDEVRSIKKLYFETETEIKEEELSLISSRDEAKKRRRFEDSNRASLKQEIRFLEEQRMKTESRISTDKNKLGARMKGLRKKEKEIENWKKNTAEMKQTQEKEERDLPAKINDLKTQIQELHKQIFSLQSENHVIEDEFKDELAKRKKMDTLKQKIAGLFEELRDSTIKTTGLLDHRGQEIFNEIIQLKPEWEQQLRQELMTIEETSESSWRALQVREYSKLESLKAQLEEQKRVAAGRQQLQQQYTDERINVSYARAYGSTLNPNSTQTLAPPQAINMYNNGSINSLLSGNLAGIQNNSYNSLNDASYLNQLASSSPNVAPSTAPAAPNYWTSVGSMRNAGLTLDTSAPALSLDAPEENEQGISPGAELYLPQNLIDGDDLHITVTADTISSVISSPSQSHAQVQSQTQIPSSASGDVSGPSSGAKRFSSASAMDSIRGSGLYGSLVNMDSSAQQITSLSALTSSLANNPSMSSPHQSLANLSIPPAPTDNISLANFDIASQHSGFAQPNLNLSSFAPPQDIEDLDLKSIKSLQVNKRSLFEPFSNSNNSSPSVQSSPNMKEAHLNKLLGNLNQTNYTRSISSADGVGTDFLSQTDFLNGSRARI